MCMHKEVQDTGCPARKVLMPGRSWPDLGHDPDTLVLGETAGWIIPVRLFPNLTKENENKRAHPLECLYRLREPVLTWNSL